MEIELRLRIEWKHELKREDSCERIDAKPATDWQTAARAFRRRREKAQRQEVEGDQDECGTRIAIEERNLASA